MKVLIYYVYMLPLFTAVFFSLKTFRLNWTSPYKLFSLFLMTTLAVEIAAIGWKYFIHYSGYGGFSSSNLWIYNLYLIPQYFFYIFFYYKVLQPGAIKKAVLGIGGFYLVFAFINLFAIQGLHSVNTYSITASNLIVIFLTCCYFFQLLKQKKLTDLKTEPLVWISVGAFIFHLACLPFFLFINHLNATNPRLSLSLFRIILVLNTSMYSFYTIAFLCRKNSPK